MSAHLAMTCIFIVSVDLFTTMIDLFIVLAAMLNYWITFWNFIYHCGDLGGTLECDFRDFLK